MSTFSTTLAPDVAGNGAFATRIVRPVARAVRRWWITQTERRMRRAAITILNQMSDRELRDIGINRSQIEWAVKGERPRDPMLHGNF